MQNEKRSTCTLARRLGRWLFVLHFPFCIFHFAFLIAPPVFSQEPPTKEPPARLPDGIRLLRTIDAKGKPGRDIVFVDRGRQLATITAAGVECWNLAAGTQVHAWPGVFQALAASPDGTTIAALDDQDDVHLFDVATHRERWKIRFTGDALAPADGPLDTAILSFSPDGKRLAVACRKDIEIWDVASQSFSQRFGPGWGARLGVVDFFPDSRRVARTGFPTYAVAIWDTDSHRNVGTFRGARYLRAGRLAPDGDAFAAGVDVGGGVHVVQFLREGTRFDLSVRVSGLVNSVAFSPDSRVVACRSIDGKLLLIHRKSLQAVDSLNVAKIGDEARPLGLAFSPSGAQLAADEGDRIAVWDLADWRKKLPAFEKLTPNRLESVWKELARPADDVDEWIDVPAVRQLVGVPDQAIPLLTAKQRPAPPVDPKIVLQLIAELDDDRFNVRERATRMLIDFDGAGKTILAERLKAGATLEQKRRIETILGATSRSTLSRHIREYRAVWIAWMIGSPAAIELLRSWAGGDRDAFLTAEAQGGLLRLQRAERPLRRRPSSPPHIFAR